jgi:long-subunit fatty acid transport protein
LAVNWYQGEIDTRDALVPHTSTSSATVTQLERRLSGLSVTAGASARVDQRLRASLAIESRPVLDNDYTRVEDGVVVSPAESSTDLELPMRVQAAAAFSPRNTHRTTFAMDVIWMNWSSVEDGLQPGLKLEDTWDVRFGLEHIYYNALPGRIGFRYSRSYAQREADRVAVTLGIGYRVENVSFDLGGEVMKRTSWQEPVWPREEQGPAVGAGNDRVEDTSARVTLGIQASF